jgi:hypothetical protein
LAEIGRPLGASQQLFGMRQSKGSAETRLHFYVIQSAWGRRPTPIEYHLSTLGEEPWPTGFVQGPSLSIISI